MLGWRVWQKRSLGPHTQNSQPLLKAQCWVRPGYQAPPRSRQGHQDLGRWCVRKHGVVCWPQGTSTGRHVTDQ